jgi:hypothetical protein
MSATMPGEAECCCPPGQVTLQVGDLIQLDRGPAVVIERNDSCAKVLRLMGKTKVIVNRFTGEPVEITTNPQPERMCMHVDRVMRLKHLTDEEYQDFLDHHQPRAVAGGKQTTSAVEQQEGQEVMAKKTKPNVGTNKTKNGSAVSFAGRPALIAKLVKSGMADDQIMVEVKAKYPGSSTCNVVKTIKAKRAKLELVA